MPEFLLPVVLGSRTVGAPPAIDVPLAHISCHQSPALYPVHRAVNTNGLLLQCEIMSSICAYEHLIICWTLSSFPNVHIRKWASTVIDLTLNNHPVFNFPLFYMSSTVRTTPVVVNVEHTEIIVSEEEETVDVCVSAVDVGSAVISVSVTDNPGTTTQGMWMNMQKYTIMCLYRLI